MSKVVHSNDKTLIFGGGGRPLACYIPNLPIDLNGEFTKELEKLPFTRVRYISRYGKINQTPRETWAYGHVGEYKGAPDVTEYRGLSFKSEPMPYFLRSLADYCGEIAKLNWGIDVGYNSVIIGKYNDGDDSIGFHTDDETFLEHHFCANVTIGEPRDFQFKIKDKNGESVTHEIKLDNRSVFFFFGLEHALPKRARAKGVRYSISFRNMKNNIGIGNSFYYCRGLQGAEDDDKKRKYIEDMKAKE